MGMKQEHHQWDKKGDQYQWHKIEKNGFHVAYAWLILPW
jgi:hypothetical protein